MKITLANKEYIVLDTIEKITIPDCFVVRQNKIGTGNGEAKLYLGQDNQALHSFFGNRGFTIKAFVYKKDLEKYLIETRAEYLKPEQNYAQKENFPILWNEKSCCKSIRILFRSSERGLF